MRKQKKKEKVIFIDTRKIMSVIIVASMCVLALLACASFFKRFLRVTDFTVIGDSPYTAHDLTNAAGLREGDRLYLIDTEDAERKLLAMCPYLETVKIESVFPNKIRIRVESYRAIWYIEESDDYYALDQNLRVLEETKDGERFRKAKIPKLTLPHVRFCFVGSQLVFGENDFEKNATLEFLKSLSGTSFMSRVTEADIGSRFNLKIKVDGAFAIDMGDASQVAVKFDLIKTIIDQALPENCVGAEIDVSNPSAAHVKKYIEYSGSNPE